MDCVCLASFFPSLSPITFPFPKTFFVLFQIFAFFPFLGKCHNKTILFFSPGSLTVLCDQRRKRSCGSTGFGIFFARRPHMVSPNKKTGVAFPGKLFYSSSFFQIWETIVAAPPFKKKQILLCGRRHFPLFPF